MNSDDEIQYILQQSVIVKWFLSKVSVFHSIHSPTSPDAAVFTSSRRLDDITFQDVAA